MLVSLDDAKLHLHIIGDQRDDDIEMKIKAASAIVLRGKGYDAVPAEWLIGSPPAVDPPDDIKALTLLWLGTLNEQREGEVLNPNLRAMDAVSPSKPIIA